MFLLTESIPLVFPHKDIMRDGLGFWFDPRSGRTFFYCVCKYSTSGVANPSYVFRFDVHDPLPQWDFVGRLDFNCKEASVSPCGRYFWSMGVWPRCGDGTRHLMFYQIDPKSMQYTEFDVTLKNWSSDDIGTINHFVRMRHTKHAGTLLIIRSYFSQVDLSGSTDLVFQMNVDRDQKIVKLEQIHLPELASAAYYPFCDSDPESSLVRKTNFGIFEDEYSLFFYQIDYFGDVFVVESQKDGFVEQTAEWIKFSIEGDTFEPLMVINNYDFFSHFLIDIWEWKRTLNRFSKFTNFNIDGNILCYGHEERLDFYRLDFHPKIQTCRSHRLFSIFGNCTHPYWNELFLLSNWQNSSSTLKTLIYYSWSVPKGWTKINVCKIAPLTQMTYWVAIQMLEKQKEKRKAIELEKEKAKSEAKKRAFWSRNRQRFFNLFQCFLANSHGSTKNETAKMQEKHNRPVEIESPTQTTTIMPTKYWADVNELLQSMAQLYSTNNTEDANLVFSC